MKKLRLIKSDHPKEEIKAKVQNMCIALIEPEDIASSLNISLEDLYEFYGFELKNTRTLAAEELVSILMDKAKSGDSAAAKFLLQRQPAWRHYLKEQINVELKDTCLKSKSEADQNEIFQPLRLKKS